MIDLEKGGLSMFTNFGATEIIILVLLAVVFFGRKKIQEVIKGFSKSTSESKKDTKEE